MNPCPCGHFGDPGGRCRCPAERVAAYRNRISGPLLDRIDLHVEVGRVALGEIADDARPECSATVSARVAAAWLRQRERQSRSNARLEGADLTMACAAEPGALQVLARAMRQLGLSARAYHRVLRVARTIADLAHSPRVCPQHVAEAITLRQLDRSAHAPADGAAIPAHTRHE